MNNLIITSLVSLAGVIPGSAEWYVQLQPGVTRRQIYEMAGQPTIATGDTDKNIRQEIEGHRISAAYALEPQIRLEEKGRIRLTARRLVFHTTLPRPAK